MTQDFQKTELQHTADLLNVINNDNSINPKKLYIAQFGYFPSLLKLRLNGEKAHKWLEQAYEKDIKEHFAGGTLNCKNRIVGENYFYFLFDDLLIHINNHNDELRLLYRKTDRAIIDKLVTELLKFKFKRRKSEISLLTNSYYGFETTSMEITNTKFSIADNYNDDFLPIHEFITKRLNKKKDKGLVLLHGKPGTGKTSYIRYLISSVKKQVIFLPPNMAASITDPGLMNVLIENPDSIFVIEDAENILLDRNCGGSSSVSALLNLADGILSDCLNIQIICSFNTDISRLDSALMRKGRIIAKYEFNELETHKAQALSNKLGFNSLITEPMTLTAVYNQNEMEFSPTVYRMSIGF
jgi:hypothetical protein